MIYTLVRYINAAFFLVTFEMLGTKEKKKNIFSFGNIPRLVLAPSCTEFQVYDALPFIWLFCSFAGGSLVVL